MSYEFATFHPLQTIFCIFRSWSVSHRHSTSEGVPMGGGTPQRKMEKRHFWCTPVPHPVQKRCEPSKTSIGVHRLWFFYPAEKKFHFEFFFEMYQKNVEKYNINRGYSVMKNNFLADKNAFTVISIRFYPYLRCRVCFCRVKCSVHSLEVAFVVMETLWWYAVVWCVQNCVAGRKITNLYLPCKILYLE